MSEDLIDNKEEIKKINYSLLNKKLEFYKDMPVTVPFMFLASPFVMFFIGVIKGIILMGILIYASIKLFKKNEGLISWAVDFFGFYSNNMIIGPRAEND